MKRAVILYFGLASAIFLSSLNCEAGDTRYSAEYVISPNRDIASGVSLIPAFPSFPESTDASIGQIDLCQKTPGCILLSQDTRVQDCRSPKASCGSNRKLDEDSANSGVTHVQITLNGKTQTVYIDNDNLAGVDWCVPLMATPPECCSPTLVRTSRKIEESARAQGFYRGMPCAAPHGKGQEGCSGEGVVTPHNIAIGINRVAIPKGTYAFDLVPDGSHQGGLGPVSSNQNVCQVAVSCGQGGDTFCPQIEIASEFKKEAKLGHISDAKAACRASLEQYYQSCDEWPKDVQQRQAKMVEEVKSAVEKFKPHTNSRNASLTRNLTECLFARENADFTPTRINYTACWKSATSTAVGLSQLTRHLVNDLYDNNLFNSYCQDFGSYWNKYSESRCKPGSTETTEANVFNQIARDPGMQVASGVIALNEILNRAHGNENQAIQNWLGSNDEDTNRVFRCQVMSCKQCLDNNGNTTECFMKTKMNYDPDQNCKYIPPITSGGRGKK